MELEIGKSINFPGAEVSEDRSSFGDFGAWVLDGSSGLTKNNFLPGQNDVLWFVDRWDEFLLESLNKSNNCLSVLKTGVEKIKERFYTIAETDYIPPLNLPSAAIALVKFKEESLEYYVLGDCTIIIQTEDGKIHYYKDDRVTEFDNQVIKCIAESNKQGINAVDTFKGFSFKILEMLRKNRLKKNTEDGYWILGFDEQAVERGIYGEFKLKGITDILLLTDGFSLLLDTYQKMDIPTFLEVAENEGLDRLYKKLRKIEKEDLDMLKYPRLKQHDDVGAVYLKINC